MIRVIAVRNVNDALPVALEYMYNFGIQEESRIGDVIVAPGPVITEYSHPRERVLFSTERDANPFFHFMEGLWMIAGRKDLAWPRQFNKRFAEYSLDGETLHGAYGHRWRSAFGTDQLYMIAQELRNNPASRRAVLQMWSAEQDLCTPQAAKDTPCNTHAYFDMRRGMLNMTVCCRSNDAIWGAYGANVVHFSMMQEVLAAMIGCGVGVYRQLSNNFHIYDSVLPRSLYKSLADNSLDSNLYGDGVVVPYEMVAVEYTEWFTDLEYFLENPLEEHYLYADDFFNHVAHPMYQAWAAHKKGVRGDALDFAASIKAIDWQKACTAWLLRRYTKEDVV